MVQVCLTEIETEILLNVVYVEGKEGTRKIEKEVRLFVSEKDIYSVPVRIHQVHFNEGNWESCSTSGDSQLFVLHYTFSYFYEFINYTYFLRLALHSALLFVIDIIMMHIFYYIPVQEFLLIVSVTFRLQVFFPHIFSLVFFVLYYL